MYLKKFKTLILILAVTAGINQDRIFILIKMLRLKLNLTNFQLSGLITNLQ